MAPRLKERYDAQVREALRQELGLSNVMEVPRLKKIVINMGVGRATQQGSLDRKSTRLNSSHSQQSRMPSSA